MLDPLASALDREFPNLNSITLQSHTGNLLRLTRKGGKTLLEYLTAEGKLQGREEVEADFSQVLNSYLARWRILGHVLDYEVVEAIALLRDAMYLKERILRISLEAAPDLVDFLVRLSRRIS